MGNKRDSVEMQIRTLALDLTDNANEQLMSLQSQYWKASDSLSEAKFASRVEQIEAIRKLSQLGLALDASAKAYKAINTTRNI